MQYCVVVTPCNGLVLLLSFTGDTPLPGSPFCLTVPYQSPVETPLPEAHPPSDPYPDLLGPADAQRLCKNDVGKEKGHLGVRTPA